MAWVAITSGAGAVGGAVVRAVQAAGWKAACIDRSRNPMADRSLLADPADEAALSAALAGLGPLRGLACLTDEDAPGPVEALTWADWQRIVACNVTAPMLAMKHARIERGGAIVLLASLRAQTGAQGHVAYAASKGAVLGLMRAACGEFAPLGVRVNAVSPGPLGPPGQARTGPVGAVTPDGVAEAVVFLLSDAAGFVTGTELVLDGGLRRRS